MRKLEVLAGSLCSLMAAASLVGLIVISPVAALYAAGFLTFSGLGYLCYTG